VTTSTSALPIAAIPVERFVERLYAPLAWEATVRLGDAAIASRLVERVLHRAWDERDRFATFDALYRHVQDAALAAVAAEAERRRDVTRFDGERHDHPVPGSLERMSLDAVRQRIADGRKPAVTPTAIAAVVAPPAAQPVAPPVAQPMPQPVAHQPAPPTAAAPAPDRAFPKPQVRMSIGREAVRGATPEDRPSARNSGAMPRPSRATPRPSGSIARFSAAPEPRFQLDERQKQLAIGAAVLAVILVLFALMRGGSPGDPQALAFAALADTTGASYLTAQAELKDVTLPDSSVARLGAGASVGTNAAFGDGARALRIAGPVSVSLRSDSTALAAITVGEHRFVTAGGVVSFATNTAGLVLVQVDSGDVVLVRDSSRVRLVEGSVVRIGAGMPMPLTRYQRDAAFGWRLGRLQLTGEPLAAIAESARQWYGVDVRFPADRAQTDTASLDVPLASRDSLVDALESALRARADVTGDRIVLRGAPATASTARRAPDARSVPALAAPTLLDLRLPPNF